jgi:hypothetical protein
MLKRSKPLTLRLAVQLNNLAAWLTSKGASDAPQTKFVDLAPTDDADAAGVYSEALKFGTNSIKIRNIALTGPYGSGKSSIIQSFLKTYQRPALHISLAAFVPEADAAGSKVSRQEIERSILQQLLYGADANKLPLSRFKRIRSPGKWSTFTSLVIMLGLLSLWFIFQKREAVISGKFFRPLALDNGLNLASFAIAMAFLWMTLHHFYVASFGISLKSISLKDIEIRPAADNPDSILNRHLDEIIYFFQTTHYDLVVIEDLDRFKNTDIFVTLREINALVNANAGVHRTVRFLYALRDDMFVNTDRTKFFEFLIPVIPIINSSNSIDMVLEQGKRLALDDRLDRQFLREVSRYLDDLRLIQNIFNEYAIYVANLETDEENVLDANKLLAILIYKNVYPRDFEQLHRGEGNLAHVLAQQDSLIANGEAVHRSEIQQLEQEIINAERQTPSDLRELRQIYAYAIIQKVPAGTNQVSLDGQSWITLQQLVDHDSFDELIGAPHIFSHTIHGQRHRLDISTLQADVDPRRSYQERRAEIEITTAADKRERLQRISELRAQISALRTIKFSELVRLNAETIDDLFKGFGEKGDLARYLILEGYLDDTYYQYTSLFHSGRLSPNDNKFLIQIRAFSTPSPDFPIDNPKEVIVAMRAEDFGQSYALNVKLVDCLLSDKVGYSDQLDKLFIFISSTFPSCEDFFEAYYAFGRDRSALLSGLSGRWKEFIPAIVASPKAISHVSQLIANVPLDALKRLSTDAGELPDYVCKNLPQILGLVPDLAPERLSCLGFEIEDLAAVSEHPSIIAFMFEKGLFQLTVGNLEYIYQIILGENDLEPLHTANYTTLRRTNNAVILTRLQRDFGTYFVEVVLGLQGNANEDADAILAILEHDELEPNDVEAFLERQTIRLPTLNGVPLKYQAMLFQHDLVKPTWANCLDFMRSEAFEREVLIEFLDREDVRTSIRDDRIPDGPNERPLRQFIVDAGTLSDAAYRDYVRVLPKRFEAFPEGLEPAKLRILIDERKVTFSKDSLAQLPDEELQVRHVATNITEFLSNPAAFELDDDFLEKLLQSEVSISAKRAIVGLLDLPAAASVPARAALVGQILDATDTNAGSLNADVARSLVVNARPIRTQISLFNKLEPVLTNEDVRHVLADLPRPYSQNKTGYQTPRLTNSPENLALVKWLATRKIISSWSEGGLFTNDIRVNLFRR